MNALVLTQQQQYQELLHNDSQQNKWKTIACIAATNAFGADITPKMELYHANTVTLQQQHIKEHNQQIMVLKQQLLTGFDQLMLNNSNNMEKLSAHAPSPCNVTIENIQNYQTEVVTDVQTVQA